MKTCLLAFLLATRVLSAPAFAHVDTPGLDVNGQCVGDANSDTTVTIDEIITAVNNALGSCPRLPVTLNFRGMVGDQPFACGTAFANIGSGQSQFIGADFRLYISGIKLLTPSGDAVPLELDQDGIWQHQDVAMLDFETGPDDGCPEGNTAINTAVHGSVPAGVYTGITFDLGIPFALDHGNVSTAPSPLNFTAMFWSWNAGYKFLRIDTGDDKFRIHLGSTGCDGGSPSSPPSSCSRPNLGRVTLTGFNPSHNVIVADIAALLADSNLDTNDPGTPPGCMADPDDTDCAPVLRNLGINPTDGSPSAATQKFFSLGSEGDEEGHVEIKIASSTDGGGKLVAHPEFDVNQPIPIVFAQCFGGNGDDCTGGTRLFTTANPGIEPIDEAEPEESLFEVADGTPVTLEVTAIDSGLSFAHDDVTLDHVGATLPLGNVPDFHIDLEAHLTQPGGGAPNGTFSATFKLTTTNAQYQSSDPVTVRFTPTLEAHGDD